MTLRVGVVGAGLIGQRRAATAASAAGSRVAVVTDVDEQRARQIADAHNARFATNWCRVVEDRDVDAVVVATPNKFLAPITIAALEAGKHVLVEKPPGRDASEAAKMAAAANAASKVLKIGFSLRFSPALRKAKQLADAGEIGDLFYLRSVYGHGGRPGYAAEWRGDRDLAGGGELLDQGVHLVDLARWFLGDFTQVQAIIRQWFWDVGELEDNAFVLLETDHKAVASLHSSWTQWKNRFSCEVFGSAGFLKVEGLGGNYGPQSLTLGRRRPESGPPEEAVFDFNSEPDSTWSADWQDFLDAIQTGRRPEVDGSDGVAVMRVIDEIYRNARPPGPR